MTETWSGRIGFLFAAIGSAVGLGSVWRFPTMVGAHGGGAYLLPYVVAVFLFATPIMILEFAMGRHFACDVVSVLRRVNGRFAVIGWIICATTFVILSYYLVIAGWTLGFSVFSIVGSGTTFPAFTGSCDPVIFFIATAIIVGLIVSSGIRAGIERVSSLIIPFIVVILCILAAFVATLPGFAEGISYYLTPDFSVLSDPSIWIAATGQAFYTLSIGMGILVTYGAYLAKEENLLASSVIVSFADLAISLLAGFVIFPIVFSFGLAPSAGAELAFLTLPAGFALMPGGRIVSSGFFLLLFLSALLSSIAMFEVVAAAAIGATGFTRRQACVLVTAGLILAGLPAALSYSGLHLTIAGANVLDTMDHFAGTIFVTVTGILTAVAFSWYVDRRTIESGIESESPFVRIIVPLCRYVIPPALILVLVAALFAG
ncbi:MAG TPA: sodium-dependent transporter [Methanoregulaceae archaeon]|nr:sodium-dependent transporter [Methanoregulaceae archaeon]